MATKQTNANKWIKKKHFVKISTLIITPPPKESLAGKREMGWRGIGEISYLYLDDVYEKVRENGQSRDIAGLIATRISATGIRQALGVSISTSEQESHWKDFLKSLRERDLK